MSAIAVHAAPKPILRRDEGPMLSGYTIPRSPLGRTAAAPPPPWHYSSDIVGVEFWTDPDAIRLFLPKGPKPDPKTGGHVVAMFLDWQFTGEQDELLDPAQPQQIISKRG